MSDDDRLTPELHSLLAAEKDVPGPDGGARDRVARRLAQTLGVTLAAAGASAAVSSGAQTVLPKALVGKSLAAKLLVAAVVGGVGVGGVVTTVKLAHRHATRHAAPAAPRVAPATPRVAPPVPPSLLLPPSAASTPGAPVLPAPSLSAVEASPPLETATTAPARAESHHALHHGDLAAESHHAIHHGDLAAEQALLADARAAMQSSDAVRALAILDDHARRFPRGQLAEERDAVRVAALWRAGDHDAARRRADEFARRHPDSLFLPSVQRAVTDPAAPAQ
jgi:hypothetical protein